MSNLRTRIFRPATLALMVGLVPVASAAGQEGEQPAASAAPVQAPVERQIVSKPVSFHPVMETAFTPVPSAVQRALAEHVATAAAVEGRAAEAEVAELAELDEEASRLRPGQFIWRPERAERGPVELVVSLEQQMAYVYRAGELIGVSTVSTGRRGHRTPTGTFPILQKNRRHFSICTTTPPCPK